MVITLEASVLTEDVRAEDVCTEDVRTDGLSEAIESMIEIPPSTETLSLL